jgi:hypothetical protein
MRLLERVAGLPGRLPRPVLLPRRRPVMCSLRLLCYRALTMRTLIATFAALLALLILAPRLGARTADAGSFCQNRYNLCLARCPIANKKCPSRCRSDFRSCVIPAPSAKGLL